MTKFRYRARDRQGKELTGYKDATDRYELARFLKNDGAHLLSVEDVTEGAVSSKGSMFERINNSLGKLSRVKLTEKMLFSKNLSVMIGAGLPLTRAIDALRRESQNPKFKSALELIIDDLRKGKAFAEALGNHTTIFSPLYVSMVDAGERSGKLKESLATLANQMEADHDIVRKVRGAMIYPAIIVVAMILIGIIMLLYVVPTLTEVFRELEVDLPFTTRMVIAVSEFILNNTFTVLAVFLVLTAALIRFFRTETGRYSLDLFFLRMPLIAPITRKFNTARTARTLSSLVSAGVQILEALDIASRVVQNHYFKNVLKEAKEEVQKGETVSKIFLRHEDLYPPLMGEMLAVGEETGESSKMLDEVAKFYEQQVADATRDLSTVVEPLLMIVIGAAVGFFAVSMISPMYTITDAL